MKVFLDTNVLVSAFATRGLSADLLELVLVEHEFVTGRAVLGELGRVLRLKLKLPASRCDEVLEFVGSEATLVVEDATPADCDVDADDRVVLGEAIAAGADVFVTGDAALIKLEAIGEMRVVTPRRLWELLREQGQQ